MIGDALGGLGAWTWLILGLVLIGLELLAPGVFLLWLGIAALLTGVVDGALGLSWQGAILVFALLSGLVTLLGRWLTRERAPSAALPTLNRRGQALVGRDFTLDGPISGGEGRIRVDDSSWRVRGPDAPAGERVRVTGVDGTTLVVETAHPASSG